MTGDPVLTLASTRDPRAEAVITGGLAAYNKETFGRVDTRTLDILVRDGDSGEVVGGLLGRSSLGCSFSTCSVCRRRRGVLGSVAGSWRSPRTRHGAAIAARPLSIP